VLLKALLVCPRSVGCWLVWLLNSFVRGVLLKALLDSARLERWLLKALLDSARLERWFLMAPRFSEVGTLVVMFEIL
jgi:hypothetical protein